MNSDSRGYQVIIKIHLTLLWRPVISGRVKPHERAIRITDSLVPSY
jgi:hypothetical protein